MPVWLLVVLLILATYRLTRLLTVDEWPPVAAPRTRIEERHDNWLGYLVGCPFCMSVHAAWCIVGLAWLVMNLWGPGMPMPVLVWASVAGAVSLLYEVIERA